MRREFRVTLLLFLSLVFFAARAAAFDWDPVSDTEKKMDTNPLDPGAGALVLFKRGEIQVQPKNNSFWNTRTDTYTRIKILNESGRDAANVVLETPKFIRLSKIEGRTILPSGEIIPLDASKVFHGVSYQSGRDFAMLTTSFAFSGVQPGAIIEYQTEEYSDWFYVWPWIFDTRGVGTLKSTLRTVINAGLAMGQLPLDTSANKIVSSRKNTALGLQTDYTVDFLSPLRDEPHAVPFRDRAVMMIFNPYEIVFAGNVISIIKKWDDVAERVSDQVTDMNKVAGEAANKAKDLAAKLPDPRARVEAIYKYLQQNITSSNLIGALPGGSTDEVLKAKKGDPDQINVVFVRMLKEVKVDADLVMVPTRNWQTLTKEFPNLTQFSRLITRVNLKPLPLFADAAEPSAPLGDLPWFEKGVTGMAIKGSKVQDVQIPAGAVDDNLAVSKFSFQISPDWKVEGDAELDLKGSYAMRLRNRMIGETPDKVEEVLTNYLGFGRGDAVVSGMAHPDWQDTSQALFFKAHVQHSVASQAGPGAVLLNPWMWDSYTYLVFKSTQRQSMILLESPEKQVGNSIWNLPPGIEVEKLPAEVNIQGDMADFSHSCTQNGSTVSCTRTFTIKKTAMTDPRGYPSTKKFFDEVAQHDQEVILLRKR